MTTKGKMNPYIFRKDDIRGIVDKDWNEKDAEKIGRAFGTWLKDNGGTSTTLGRDNRLSSDKFRQYLVKGLTLSGIKVIDLGLVTTPMVYWGQIHLKADGGIVITGSHTPPEWNGIKMCFRGKALYGVQIEKIKKIVEGGEFAQGEGKLYPREIFADYKKAILSSIRKVKKATTQATKKSQKRLKVVIDCGNAITGPFAPEILRELNCKVEELHTRLDGTFPNHFPDPAKGVNTVELVAKVKEEKADLGVGFDGDGDRINIVDEKGFILWGDGVVMFFARDILKFNPRTEIIFNVECSPALKEDVVAHGGIPVMLKTGHSLIQTELVQAKALLGGEYSGHIYFADYYPGIDDAIYAAARAIEILQREKKPLSKLMADAPFYLGSGKVEIFCPDEKKYQVAKKVGEILDEKYFVNHLDGALVKFANGLSGWGLTRASDNLPKINVMSWAKDKKNLEKICDLMVREVKRYL